eukprot:4600418-Alexandrium_andersonii.AAC.1
MNAWRWASRASMSALRDPGRRLPSLAWPRVAGSDRKTRAASTGGIAANIASPFQNATSFATHRLRTF